jgi:hypothetical protein
MDICDGFSNKVSSHLVLENTVSTKGTNVHAIAQTFNDVYAAHLFGYISFEFSTPSFQDNV